MRNLNFLNKTLSALYFICLPYSGGKRRLLRIDTEKDEEEPQSENTKNWNNSQSLSIVSKNKRIKKFKKYLEVFSVLWFLRQISRYG